MRSLCKATYQATQECSRKDQKMLVKEILISLAVLAVPKLVVSNFEISENFYYLILGIVIGIDLGWWGSYFFSDYRAKLITAMTAKLAEENAEKHRQWERERQDAITAEEAKMNAARQEIEDAKNKAIQEIRNKYEISIDLETLVAKDKSDSRRYCKNCGLKAGKEIELKRNNSDNRWVCPYCGHGTLPSVIR